MDAVRKLDRFERSGAKEWEGSDAGSTIIESEVPTPTGIYAANSKPQPRAAPLTPPKPAQGLPIPVTKYGETHGGMYVGRGENGVNTSQLRQFPPHTIQTRPSHAHQERIRSANFELANAQYGRLQPSLQPQIKLDLTSRPSARPSLSNVHNQRGRLTMAQIARKPPPTVWAEPPPLVTNRLADAKEEKQKKQEEDEEYLLRPDPDEEFPAVAYYVWPSNMPDGTPTDILGHNLEELNAVRIENRVFILMNKANTCIKICSRLDEGSDERLQSAISAIREKIRARQAIKKRARPLRIVMPPTAVAMTTFIKPAIVQWSKKPRIRIVSHIGLGDNLLSDEERLKWENGRPELLRKCQQSFEAAMDTGLRQLSPYKGWMQMRLRFGRIELQDPKVRFKRGHSDWNDFTKMMAADRMDSSLKPALDANVVKHLCQKILGSPEIFGPADGRHITMIAEPFKDTEIIFFHTSAGPYRMEVEIDKISETQEGEYQVGSTRVFKDNKRNKRLRVTNVGAEKEMDWEIEIITDNAIPMDEVPASMLKMGMDSVTTHTIAMLDTTGLYYPRVSPRAPSGAIIDGVVVKTVVEYAIKASGYVIQLALYRRWTPNTPEMEISAGVTMFHRDWDYYMRDLERTAEPRNWNDPLKLFFGHYADSTHEAVEGSQGVANFLSDVENMRDCLADAVREIEAVRKQETAMEAEQEAGQMSMENPGKVPAQIQAGEEGEVPNISGLNVSNTNNQPSQAAAYSGEDVYEDLYSAD